MLGLIRSFDGRAEILGLLVGGSRFQVALGNAVVFDAVLR
jgi:hypothetical protein